MQRTHKEIFASKKNNIANLKLIYRRMGRSEFVVEGTYEPEGRRNAEQGGAQKAEQRC